MLRITNIAAQWEAAPLNQDQLDRLISVEQEINTKTPGEQVYLMAVTKKQ